MSMKSVWAEINCGNGDQNIGHADKIIVASNEIAEDINKHVMEYVRAGHSLQGKHLVVETTPYEDIDFSKDVITATITWRIEEDGKQSL